MSESGRAPWRITRAPIRRLLGYSPACDRTSFHTSSVRRIPRARSCSRGVRTDAMIPNSLASRRRRRVPNLGDSEPVGLHPGGPIIQDDRRSGRDPCHREDRHLAIIDLRRIDVGMGFRCRHDREPVAGRRFDQTGVGVMARSAQDLVEDDGRHHDLDAALRAAEQLKQGYASQMDQGRGVNNPHAVPAPVRPGAPRRSSGWR